jgi:hypothetical protein
MESTSPLFVIIIQVISSNLFGSTIAYKISHNFELWCQWTRLRNEDQNVITKRIVCNLEKYTNVFYKNYVVSIYS